VLSGLGVLEPVESPSEEHRDEAVSEALHIYHLNRAERAAAPGWWRDGHVSPSLGATPHIVKQGYIGDSLVRLALPKQDTG
jgi:hypothetical protein